MVVWTDILNCHSVAAVDDQFRSTVHKSVSFAFFFSRSRLARKLSTKFCELSVDFLQNWRNESQFFIYSWEDILCCLGSPHVACSAEPRLVCPLY